MPSNSKLSSSRSDRGNGRRNALVWCGVVICTILTLAVIIAGIVIFIGYLVIHPRVPYISVIDGHLDRIHIDRYSGTMETQVSLRIQARNGNRMAHARFSHSNYTLSFDEQDIAQLVAPEFEVGKHSFREFDYVVRSLQIPLSPDQAGYVEAGFYKDMVTFDLKGGARVRWRIGRLGSFSFLCHLECFGMDLPKFIRPKEGHSESSPNLYVANCGPAVGLSMDAIASTFSSFGEIKGLYAADESGARVIVSFTEPASAHSAFNALNGRSCPQLGGRTLHIRHSILQPQSPRIDKVNETMIRRGSRRVSFTFRKVRRGPYQCEFPQYCDSQSQR